MTQDPREEACNRFIDGEGLGYIKTEAIEGVPTLVLYGEGGDAIAMADRLFKLEHFAKQRGMTVWRVH